MFRVVVLAALVAGCVAEGDGDALVDEALAPPGSLTLTISPLVPGGPATFEVRGGPARRTVHFARASAVQAGGFCPAFLLGDCLDLSQPVVDQFQANTNGAGVASVNVNVPPVLPMASVAFQAIIPGANYDSSAAVSATIYPPASDTDGDTLSALDEVSQYGTDPGNPDTDGGGLDDNDEIAVGSDPLDGTDDVVPQVTIDGVGVGDLVITEIMKDPAGAVADGDGEWFEILNRSGANVDLRNMVLSDNGGNAHRVNTNVIVRNRGRAVIGINANPALNGGVTLNYSYQGAAFLLDNADDEVVLSNAFGEIARVNYDDGVTFPDVSGASLSLDPGLENETANNVGGNWCPSTATFGGLGQLGSPGLPNPPCP